MEYVRIAVLDHNDSVVAFLDNGVPGATHYYNDSLHEYLQGTASTFSLTVLTDTEDSRFLIDGYKLAFSYNDRDYYFNIMRIERNEREIFVEAHSLSFELLNETVYSYAATTQMSFLQYLDIIDWEKTLVVGVNEVSDKNLIYEWQSGSTILNVLLDLAEEFYAEIEFVPVLNDDYSLKHLLINIYKEHSDKDQGVGKNRTAMTFRYGVDISGVRKTSDVSDLYTSISLTGKDGLTVSALDRMELDADGSVEFQTVQNSTHIRAVLARDRFPSNLMNANDRYIAHYESCDIDDVELLYLYGLLLLKIHSVPKVEYEIEGYIDTGIGDTVSIEDDEYKPTLYLEARVSEQIRSFTTPSRNKTVFSNFIEKRSEINSQLYAKMQEMIESKKIFSYSIISNNGVIFKNNEGTTTLTAIIKDGGVDVTGRFTIVWFKDDVQVGIGTYLTIAATQINGKSVIRYEAIDANDITVGSYEVTIVNVHDGVQGDTGPQGPPGTNGATGANGDPGEQGVGIADVIAEYYLSTSKTQQTDGSWSPLVPTWEIGKYMWIRTKVTYTDDNVIYTEPYSDSGWEAAQAVDDKLGAYATVSDMNTNIQNSEESILATASATYATKADVTLVDGKFLNYSTTVQMNSAINQKANEINQSVSAVQITANNALNTANAAQTGVTDVNNNLTNDYSTTVQMHSAINQKADSITQSVSETYATKTSLTGLTTRVSIAESKLTPTALTTTISSALSGGNSIQTTKFIMDKDGLLIRDGGFKIMKGPLTVFYTDTDGNLKLRGSMTIHPFEHIHFNDSSLDSGEEGTNFGRIGSFLTRHLSSDGTWINAWGIYIDSDDSISFHSRRMSINAGGAPLIRTVGSATTNKFEVIVGSNSTCLYYLKNNDVENLYLVGSVSFNGPVNLGMNWATYGGRRVPRFHAGSKVVNANGQDSTALLTLAELQTAFNAPGAAATSMAVFVSNGDGVANNAHAEAATYVNGNWYVTFNKGVQGVRINYLAIYWG